MQCVCGSSAAGGWVRAAASRLRPKSIVYKNGLSASRNQQVKTNGAGCRASPD